MMLVHQRRAARGKKAFLKELFIPFGVSLAMVAVSMLVSRFKGGETFFYGGEDLLPKLEEALNKIKCLRIVLQWIPSHCGVEGNEEADKMAKLEAKEQQPNNGVSPKEIETIIQSLHGMAQRKDNYHTI